MIQAYRILLLCVVILCVSACTPLKHDCPDCPEPECPACPKCTCTPDCNQKICGGEGCGSSCGECAADELCADGRCTPKASCATMAGALGVGSNKDGTGSSGNYGTVDEPAGAE